MREYACNQTNITFMWLRSLYNPFKKYFLGAQTGKPVSQTAWMRH